MPAYPQLSLTREQTWADKQHCDRLDWFDSHGEQFARERGALVFALEAYANAIKARGAHEARSFDVNRFISDMLDSADAALAPEVVEWLDSVPAPLKLVAAE